MDIIIGIFIISLLIIASITGWRAEAKDWNGGIAPSGAKWVRFDVDSQGRRGYKDPEGETRIFVSWCVDKN